MVFVRIINHYIGQLDNRDKNWLCSSDSKFRDENYDFSADFSMSTVTLSRYHTLQVRVEYPLQPYIVYQKHITAAILFSAQKYSMRYLSANMIEYYS